ncbi:hypothetical protein BDZ89DRAFT_1165422 [Hymenopellis radicata]|nr:hypothetical protein BDZ89DRAFT_1165422 [Hymenopellis radicata]
MPKIMPTRLELWDDSTSRWLFNDREQRALRHVDYNVQELISSACVSVGATGCTEMIKIAEGAYNKVFRLTFNNEQTAIARIPSTLMFGSGVSWATSSEVATLHLMCNYVKLRVPKVLAWAKDATNPVGSSYIILEDIAGVPLHHEWRLPDTRGEPVMKLVLAVCNNVARAAFLSYAHLGSLYFREDFPSRPPAPLLPEHYARQLPDFEASSTVGPIANVLWWRPFHDKAGFNRGPWDNIAECIRSAIALERRAVQRHREDPSSLCFTRSKIEDLDEVEHLLSKVEAMAPRIDAVFSTMNHPEWSTHGILVHPDLRANNLIVPPRTEDNIESRLAAPVVIDWQGASILPLPFQAHIPHVVAFEPTIFDSDGNPMISIDENEVSPLPPDIELSPEQRGLAEAERRRAARQAAFVETLSRLDQWKLLLTTGFFPDLFRPLFQGILRACADGPLGLRCLLMGIEQIWGNVHLWGPVPFSFTEQEREAHKREMKQSSLYEVRLQLLMDRLNCAEDGCVDKEQYETAMEELKKAKNEWMRKNVADRFHLRTVNGDSIYGKQDHYVESGWRSITATIQFEMLTIQRRQDSAVPGVT